MTFDEGTDSWRKRQARWTIPDVTEAIHLRCRECNGEDRFVDSNDCVSSSCPIFPFRPGTCRPEVDGVRRAARQRRGCRENLANRRDKPSLPRRSRAGHVASTPEVSE